MQPWTEAQNQPNLKITGLVQFSLNFYHIWAVAVVVVIFFFLTMGCGYHDGGGGGGEHG